MSFVQDDYLTLGVPTRRCVAWVLDLIVIGILWALLWWVLAMFGVLTLGYGFGLMVILPFVPFAYHMLSLLGSHAATFGQRIVGLTVRRDDDLALPTVALAAISTLLFYASLSAFCLPMLLALVTKRRRTLHDLASGLVVVHRRALETLTPGAGAWNMYHGSPDRPA